MSSLVKMVQSVVLVSIILIAIEYVLLGVALMFTGKFGLGGSYICYAGANIFIYYAALGI